MIKKAILALKNIGDDKILVRLPTSLDFNCIENLWSIVNQDLYKGGKQYSSNSELWEAIEAAYNAIPSSNIKHLSKSMDVQVAQVLKNPGGYIGH